MAGDFLRGTNVYLIGMMGAGKTTIGQRLATALGYQFFDTDALIEQVTGSAIADIFAHQGEATFRQTETDVLSQISAYTRLVVATGGGIVLQRQNWSYLHHGAVVWLDVPFEQLRQRLQGDSHRPLLQTDDWPDRLQTLINQRQSLYAQADVRVSSIEGESPDATVIRVIAQLQAIVRPELSPPLESN